MPDPDLFLPPAQPHPPSQVQVEQEAAGGPAAAPLPSVNASEPTAPVPQPCASTPPTSGNDVGDLLTQEESLPVQQQAALGLGGTDIGTSAGGGQQFDGWAGTSAATTGGVETTWQGRGAADSTGGGQGGSQLEGAMGGLALTPSQGQQPSVTSSLAAGAELPQGQLHGGNAPPTL